MKTKYYHSNIEINELPKYVEVDDINKYKNIVKQYNNAKTLNEKIKFSNQLPNNLFSYCRFCGKKIININFKLKIVLNKIYNILPKYSYRIINGVTYELSCCEECLLNHFKDNLPKSQKYYFMKANKYGAYSFNYTYDIYKQVCSSTVAVTLKSMINKYGDEEGKIRWKKYCDKQSLVNSFEYKHKKYNWTNEQFKEFNKSRATTLNNFISRYGEIEGINKWNKYCDNLKYINSKQRYIDEFGKNGIEIYNKICKSKAITLNHYIKKYGEEIGTIKYKEYLIKLNKQTCCVSNISQIFFTHLLNILKMNNIDTNNIYFQTLNYEYQVIFSDKTYLLDFYDSNKNLIIEFNGDYWHANPKKYASDDIIFKPGDLKYKTNIFAHDIWNADNIRKNNVCNKLNNPIYIEIWESDYNNNENKLLSDILKIYLN